MCWRERTMSTYEPFTGYLSRRSVLRRGFAVGAGLTGAALIGCSSGPKKSVNENAAAGGAAAPKAPELSKERDGMPVVKGTPKKGGTFTVAATETYVQHDQHTAVSNSEWVVIGERAIELDEFSGKLRPNLVESWENPDKNTYIFKVKKGVKLHNKAPWNGREFDAEDLAFNLNRIAGNTADAEKLPKGNFQRSTTLEGVGKIEVIDKSTVKVTMAKVNSALLNGITEIRNVMMPKGIVEVGFKDPMKFAGTAPFQMAESVEGTRQSYSRFEGYYRPNEPYFDKVVQTVIPDRAATLAAFVSKQISVLSSPTGQEIKTIQSARQDALLYSYVAVNYNFVMFNLKHKPFQDFRVRKALNMATDYEDIANGFHGSGWGWMAAFHQAFPEAWQDAKVKSIPGINPATKAKDREEAAKLLAAAGYTNGDKLEFDIMHKPKAESRENALRFQAQMTKLFPGIKIVIKAPETAVFDKAQASKDFQAISNDSTMNPDAVLEGYARWHSQGSRNYGGFADPKADALLEKALGETDPKLRADILNDFQQQYVDAFLPQVNFYATPQRHFVQPDVGGFDKVFGPWDSLRGVTQKLGRIYNV